MTITCNRVTDEMSNTIEGARRMIVKKAIKEYADDVDGNVRPGTLEYDDLMANVEGQVQSVLEENGDINW